MKVKTILFLTPYPHSTAPSQRFRFEQYFLLLKLSGYKFETLSFLDNRTWEILYLPGHNLEKVVGIATGFLRRFILLFSLSKYDFIFIHREVAPLGPPIFEWIIAKILRKKIIYDFDDAIWLPNTSQNNKIAARVKWHQKVADISRWSYKVSVGNGYLADYARQHNHNVVLNPTTIDTEGLHNKVKFGAEAILEFVENEEKKELRDLFPTIVPNLQITYQKKTPVIGWTGSHSTLTYLNDIIPALQNLEKEFPFEFRVISNRDPNLPLQSFRFLKWQKETEIEDLFQFDIGLMPLTEDQWAKGKCGFKALQYMALGIPPLVSPVGVNTEIVQHGVNGFICDNQEDWEKYIKLLLQSPELRLEIGKAARTTVEEKYSVKSNAGNFLRLFE